MACAGLKFPAGFSLVQLNRVQPQPPITQMSTWHYMKNGTQAGPATTEEIQALLASGGLGGEALVWREGLAGWAPANSQPEFAGAARAVPPAPPAPGALTTESADVEKNKVFAILAYLPPLLFLVPLLAARESKFAMYHCNQGLVLTLTAIVIGVINAILGAVLIFIPFLGWFLLMILHLGTFIGIVALAVIGLINAANGVCKPLPVIGDRFTLVK
jgi:uncharacterized membrane protein